MHLFTLGTHGGPCRRARSSLAASRMNRERGAVHSTPCEAVRGLESCSCGVLPALAPVVRPDKSNRSALLVHCRGHAIGALLDKRDPTGTVFSAAAQRRYTTLPLLLPPPPSPCSHAPSSRRRPCWYRHS